MIFSSNLFLFVFLPISLSLYFISAHLKPNLRSTSLILLSICFYSYWEWSHTSIILLSISVNFIFHIYIAKFRSTSLFVTSILFNIVLLFYFKYAFFFATSLSLFPSSWSDTLSMALPLGISFFTFQQIAFLSDVYRGITPAQSLSRYALFVTFFPQLVAGPIVHHHEMMPQFSESKTSNHLLGSFGIGLGLSLLIIGLFKKVVIADNLAALVTPIFDAAAEGYSLHMILAWTGTLAYTFQLYFDFSAYSDMAMGLALMFGIKLPANFNSPYKARSIIEFWRRWHMTLSRFLRDYIYIPLGGNRQGQQARYINLMVTMLIGGFWHGAGWTFLFWGGFHGFLLIVNHLWVSSRASRTIVLPSAFAWMLTFLMVTLAWVSFRADSLGSALEIYKSMFGFSIIAFPLEIKPLVDFLGLEAISGGINYFAENSRRAFYTGFLWITIAALIAFFAPNSIQITRRFYPATNMTALEPDWTERGVFASAQKLEFQGRAVDGIIAGAVLALVVILLNAAPAGEFLYFQF